MMKPFAAALLALALSACSPSTDTPPAEKAKPATPAPMARGKALGIRLSLIVDSVDVEKRIVGLKNSEGQVASFQVSEAVKRLPEIKKGDTLNVDYSVIVVAELREPTEQEKREPIVAVRAGARAPADLPPAGGLIRAIRAATVIDAMDATASTVTFKGPLGGRVTANVEDRSIFPTLRVGQSVIVDFEEMLILSVDPAEPKK